MRRLRGPPAHQPVMKPEEVKPRAPLGQVHDTGLGRLGLQPESGQQGRELRKRSLCLFPGAAHHHHVVGIADQFAMLLGPPCPVQPVQVGITEQR